MIEEECGLALTLQVTGILCTLSATPHFCRTVGVHVKRAMKSTLVPRALQMGFLISTPPQRQWSVTSTPVRSVSSNFPATDLTSVSVS
jgi:hypothetical protein